MLRICQTFHRIVWLLEDIRDVLVKILHKIPTQNPTEIPFALRFSIPSLHQMFFQGDSTMSNITTEQQVDVTVVAKTQGGAVAQIFGDVTFTSSDETVATVTSTGPATATVVAVGVGAAQINAVFEGDATAGVDTITLSGAVNVVPAEAAVGELDFGTPVLKPVAPPATP